MHIAYPGWVLLQRGQVALHSQAAAVVEQSLHAGHVRLHQLLPLAGCLLLQLLHLLLETLHTHRHINCRSTQGKRRVVLYLSSNRVSHLDDGLLVSTWEILSFPLSLLPLSHHLSTRKGREKASVYLISPRVPSQVDFTLQ